MRPFAARQNQVADDCVRLRSRQEIVEVMWAAICPPLLAVLVIMLTSAWLEGTAGNGSQAIATNVMIPLMLAGMTILSGVIYLNCRAVEVLHSSVAIVRTTLGFSAAMTLIFLAVGVTAQAERNQVPQAAEMVLFLCLPVLFVCGALLWHCASIIRSSSRRVLMLAGFLTVTAFVELQCASEVSRNAEERLFMLNSLLIALAFAIQLGVWSAKEFGRR